VPLNKPTKMVDGHYAYILQKDGTWLVWSITDKDLKEALKDMRCPCAIQDVGKVHIVTTLLKHKP
jgi:hypothetical protein